MVLSILVVEIVFLIGLRDPIIAAFTSNDEIQQIVRQSWPVFGAIIFLGANISVGLAFLIASGKQMTGAALYLIAYGCIGIPIGLYLTLKTGFGNSGVWLGCAVAGVFLLISFESILSSLDWPKLFREVQERRRIDIEESWQNNQQNVIGQQ